MKVSTALTSLSIFISLSENISEARLRGSRQRDLGLFSDPKNGNGGNSKVTDTQTASTAKVTGTQTASTAKVTGGNANNGGGNNKQPTTTQAPPPGLEGGGGEPTEPEATTTTTSTSSSSSSSKGNNGNGGSGGKGNGNSNNGGGSTTTTSNKPKVDTSKGNGFGANGSSGNHNPHFSPPSSSVMLDESPITLSQNYIIYGDSLTVSFPPVDLNEYTTNLEMERGINTTEVPVDVSQWKIGVYMRMGHPQGGSLSPIVALSPSLEYGEGDDASLVSGSVTFSSAQELIAQMTGSHPTWPTDLDVFGTGYDVWLLDQYGAEVMGPTMYVCDYTQSMVEEIEGEESDIPQTGLTKFNKGVGKKGKGYGPTADGSSSGGNVGGKGNGNSNGKGNNNGVAGASSSSFDNNGKGSGKGSGKDGGMILSTTESLATYALVTDSFAYPDYTSSPSISITYDLGAAFDPTSFNPEKDLTQWTIGIYMRMANPQDGALDPIVSIPLCNTASCDNVAWGDLISGVVTFDNAAYANGNLMGEWPLDLGRYGNGYDVWILDEEGNGMAGPTMFVIPDVESS